MLINRFREDDVQVTGQKLDGGGARFEIFFNGQCVFSKVVYDILFNTLKNDQNCSSQLYARIWLFSMLEGIGHHKYIRK